MSGTQTAAPSHGAARRLGIFGGSFDPPHTGHLVAAQDVLESLKLERVLFVPAARPPHKEADRLSDARLRLRMVQAVVEDDRRFTCWDGEFGRQGPSYTVDTLAQLRKAAPDAELFLLLGVDQWADFATWRDPRGIAGHARLVVMTRDGGRAGELEPGFDDGPAPDHLEVPVTRIDISSTRIRDRVRDGRSIRYLVPDPIRRIIESAGLYL